MLRLLVALLLMTAPVFVCAQVLPQEGSKLNFRMVGFSAPDETGGKGSTLEIAAGKWNSADSFAQHKVKSVAVQEHKVIVEVPAFGMQYTWRVVGAGGGDKNESSGFHHFSTGYYGTIDTNNFRVRILKPAEKYQDAYFFVDHTRALYDMKGNALWYLPDSSKFKDFPVDLKMSPYGTITMLYESAAYEVNFNGDILWKTPHDAQISGDSVEHYNHQFSMLKNGHYMILGKKAGFARMVLPETIDTDYLIDDSRARNLINDPGYVQASFGTLIEYNKTGEIVWSWKLSDYFKHSDLPYFTVARTPLDFDMHQNAFYFDEKNKVIYLSLKACSRILKIAYPSGKVLAEYGSIFKREAKGIHNGPFVGQHACNVDAQGRLYVYNNNAFDSTGIPEVEVFEMGDGKGNILRKTWAYDCPVDADIANKPDQWKHLATGGNVYELPDRSFFVTMAGESGQIFIVDRNKSLLWRAQCEHFLPHRQEWVTQAQYRASIIANKGDVERMVWEAESANEDHP